MPSRWSSWSYVIRQVRLPGPRFFGVRYASEENWRIRETEQVWRRRPLCDTVPSPSFQLETFRMWMTAIQHG